MEIQHGYFDQRFCVEISTFKQRGFFEQQNYTDKSTSK